MKKIAKPYVRNLLFYRQGKRRAEQRQMNEAVRVLRPRVFFLGRRRETRDIMIVWMLMSWRIIYYNIGTYGIIRDSWDEIEFPRNLSSPQFLSLAISKSNLLLAVKFLHHCNIRRCCFFTKVL